MQWRTLQYISAGSAVQCSTVQCSEVQCSIVQYSAVQFSTVKNSCGSVTAVCPAPLLARRKNQNTKTNLCCPRETDGGHLCLLHLETVNRYNWRKSRVNTWRKSRGNTWRKSRGNTSQLFQGFILLFPSGKAPLKF